jgi:hypothetical protein
MHRPQSGKPENDYKSQNHSSVQSLFFFNSCACIIRSSRRPYRRDESALKNTQKPGKPAVGLSFWVHIRRYVSSLIILLTLAQVEK